MSELPSRAFRLLVDDPEVLSGAIHGTCLRPMRLGRKPATSELGRLKMPSSCLDFAHIGPSMHFSGATTKEGYTLIFVLECPTAGRSFNFSTDHGADYLGLFPPGAALDAVTPAGYANATLTVSTTTFLAAAMRYFPEFPESSLSRGGAMRIPPPEQMPLRVLVSDFRRMVAADPAAFTDLRAVHLIEQELIAAFLRAVRGGSEHLVPPPPSRISRRENRFYETRERIDAQLGAPISIADLAGAVGLSDRGLENLFRDYLGIGPALYLRQRRLHAARSALVEARPYPGLVKKIAFDHGFWHLGRFAKYYRDYFGEHPSETMLK